MDRSHGIQLTICAHLLQTNPLGSTTLVPENARVHILYDGELNHRKGLNI
jgi:hypothetical protein